MGDCKLNKDVFFYGSENGTGPTERLRTMKDHYIRISGAFRLKGMDTEADLFADAAHELTELDHEIKTLLTQRHHAK